MLAGHRFADTVVRSQVEDEVTLLFKRFAAELTDEQLKHTTAKVTTSSFVHQPIADERDESAEGCETLPISSTPSSVIKGQRGYTALIWRTYVKAWRRVIEIK